MMNQWHRLFFKLRKWWNDLRKLHFELIADNEVNVGNAAKHFEAGLGITPGYRDKGLGRMTEDLANNSSAIHLSPFRDRAGINHEDIRFLPKFYRDKPAPLKPVFEYSRFSLVEPTP
jgi:hypothetical protein